MLEIDRQNAIETFESLNDAHADRDLIKVMKRKAISHSKARLLVDERNRMLEQFSNQY